MPKNAALPGDTCSLSGVRSTPFPNDLLEAVIRLPSTQLRIVLVVLRWTLGWKAGPAGERKASACISYRELLRLTGLRSAVAISRAVGALADAGILEISAEDGRPLRTAAERRRYAGVLRFRLGRRFVGGSGAVDNCVEKPVETRN